ncbi:hypothetical protein [Streptosporangium amethystogenes]|uniref:hypothetical protein n=1 Tax=Streptosporangium amethystogenes TaxID=2002 RepID=UPI0012F99DF3|nr:hypothetical protein [Streptosporangium amethystogenes]
MAYRARAPDERRYLREVEKNASTRDAVITLPPHRAGLRIGEVAALDMADVRRQSPRRKADLLRPRVSTDVTPIRVRRSAPAG